MTLTPAPIRNPLTVSGELLELRVWPQWLTKLVAAVNAAPSEVGTVSLTAQAATIPTTTLPTPVLGAGLYRLTAYLRVTQAATVSSSLTLTLGWTDGAVACTSTQAALIGNTTSTTQATSLVVHADAASLITDQVTYVSVGATPMQYALYVRVEALP